MKAEAKSGARVNTLYAEFQESKNGCASNPSAGNLASHSAASNALFSELYEYIAAFSIRFLGYDHPLSYLVPQHNAIVKYPSYVVDAVSRIWEKMGSFRDDGKTKFSTWAYKVAKNVIYDRIRYLIENPEMSENYTSALTEGGGDEAFSMFDLHWGIDDRTMDPADPGGSVPDPHSDKSEFRRKSPMALQWEREAEEDRARKIILRLFPEDHPVYQSKILGKPNSLLAFELGWFKDVEGVSMPDARRVANWIDHVLRRHRKLVLEIFPRLQPPTIKRVNRPRLPKKSAGVR